jgi:hypothetical protein
VASKAIFRSSQRLIGEGRGGHTDRGKESKDGTFHNFFLVGWFTV